MEITKDTRVSDILRKYGDIAKVMEVFGIGRVGRWSIRRIITKFITVKIAAKMHHADLDVFLDRLQKAIALHCVKDVNLKIEEPVEEPVDAQCN